MSCTIYHVEGYYSVCKPGQTFAYDCNIDAVYIKTTGSTYVCMGVNNMRGARATTNKIDSKFNTVTLDRSYFTVCLSDL